MTHAPDVALVRALRQNAATIALMGVDFVPVRSHNNAPMVPSELEPKRLIAPTKPEPIVARVVAQQPAVAVGAPRPPESSAGTDVADGSRERAQQQLDDLLARYERDAPHKNFVTDHHNIVFGEGDPCARLMFVGEAPGAEEDRVGRPFVGRSGQLLDKMINAMGLSREGVYIANVLKTRPPDNATPTSDECALCAPYLYEQIMIIRPEAIVTLGLPASRTLLNSTESMMRLRGQWHRFQPPAALLTGPSGKGLDSEWSVPLMPTYHPAFILRSYTPENRAKVWSDLQQVMDRLGLGNASMG